MRGHTSRSLTPDGGDPGGPMLRYGCATIVVDTSERRLPVEVRVGARFAPGAEVKVEVQTAPRAEVALAVVDELLTDPTLQIDYVLYNASGADGDPGAFVAPLLHNRQIDQLVAVSTAEIDGLRAVNRLLQLLRTIDRDHAVEVGGIIGNHLPAPYAEAVIDSFAWATGIPVTAFIAQSLVVTRSAFFGASVIDAAPLAHHAYLYRKAARALVAAGLR